MSTATMNQHELWTLRAAASLISKIDRFVEQEEGKEQCRDIAATLKRLAWLHEHGMYGGDGNHVVTMNDRPVIHLWESEAAFRASEVA